jgi:hypothetical protein
MLNSYDRFFFFFSLLARCLRTPFSFTSGHSAFCHRRLLVTWPLDHSSFFTKLAFSRPRCVSVCIRSFVSYLMYFFILEIQFTFRSTPSTFFEYATILLSRDLACSLYYLHLPNSLTLCYLCKTVWVCYNFVQVFSFYEVGWGAHRFKWSTNLFIVWF